MLQEKKWNKSYLAIEDPFDLNRNLAACVTSENGKYILKCFDKARLHIEAILKDNIKIAVDSLNIEYLFDIFDILPKQNIHPLYHKCVFCLENGHKTRDCRLKKLQKQSKVSFLLSESF